MPEKPKPSSDPWLDLQRLLRERPRSVMEVRRHLKRRGHDEAAIDGAVRMGHDAGVLDDRAFAKLWINDRLWHHPLARMAVRQELRDKGVDASISEPLLQELYPAVREIGIARELAEARFERLRGIDADRRRNRTVDYLTRRGFSRSTACDVVRQIERQVDE